MRCACSDGGQRSSSSVDGQSFEVAGCDLVTPGAGDTPTSLSVPPVQYWRPMCVELKYDGYSSSHDYSATTTTAAAAAAGTTGTSDVTALDDDVPATSVSLQSTVDRRNCFRLAACSRATNLPAAARLYPARPPARCDEHLYEPTNHDTAPSSRDHRTFNDFVD